MGDGLLAQKVYFAVDFLEGVLCGRGGDVGCDVEHDTATEYLGGAVDAVGVAFVFAQVAHEARAEVSAKDGVEHHEAGVVGAVPCEGHDAANADGGLYGVGYVDMADCIGIGFRAGLGESHGGGGVEFRISNFEC